MNAITPVSTPRTASNRRLRFFAIGVAGAALSVLSPFAHASAGAYVPPPQKPKFSQMPVSVTVDEGLPVTFSAAATGYPVPTFQWSRNGAAIKDATTDKFTLAHAKSGDSGTYTVTAWNSSGTVTSTPATLVVTSNVPLLINIQPASMVAAEGDPVAFEIIASSPSELGFRWRKNGVFIAGATTSRLVFESVGMADAGDYDAVVSNLSGSVISRTAKLTVVSAGAVARSSSATEIIWHPANATAAVGGDASLTVDAIGNGLTYQWKKNGRPVAGATRAMLSIPRATAADMGFYSVVVSGADAAIESKIAIVNVTSGGTSRLGNLSTRGFVPAGGALTVGFTLRGVGNKQVLARAVGPTLARFGVEGSLSDPQLQIIPAGASAALVGNDDWCMTNDVTGFLLTSNAVGAFALDAGSKDAALLTSLNAASGASYTARIVGADARNSGIVLAEIYDGDPAGVAGRLAAISTLAFAGSGARALVPGFTIDGAAPKRLLIRAVGPGLDSFGVAGALASPKLAIIPAGMTQAVATNDGWRGDAVLANAFAAAGAFALDRDSKDAALIVTLPPGGYTVNVSGVDDTAGTALFEIYDLEP